MNRNTLLSFFVLRLILNLTEDLEMSLNDYKKALAILEHIVEPDHRRVVELYPQIVLFHKF